MSASTPIELTIGGKKVEDTSNVADVLSFTVERDMGQPDMAAIVISNQDSFWSAEVKPDQDVIIKVGDEKKEIYKGKVVGMEGDWKGTEKSRLTVRAMNDLHLLLRKRKSITFTDKTDEEILSQVASPLSLKFKHEKPITYKHVYQHNQTDLEFLRMRAARIGCRVWCWGNELHVEEPDLNQGEMATLKLSKSGEAAVRHFSPRLSSAAILKKVTVKGWNPETKELIEGKFEAQNSNLGDENSVTGSGKPGQEESFTVDHPIWTKQEADVLAKARLVDLSLSYISGECEVRGDPKFDLGKVVKIVVSEHDKEPFNGKYYVVGITHRYSSTKTKDGGYFTVLRLARDAQKGK